MFFLRVFFLLLAAGLSSYVLVAARCSLLGCLRVSLLLLAARCWAVFVCPCCCSLLGFLRVSLLLLAARCWAFFVGLIVVVSGSYQSLYHLVGEEEAVCFVFSLVCGICIVCHGLFALSLGVICTLCSVIVSLSGHLYYFYCICEL